MRILAQLAGLALLVALAAPAQAGDWRKPLADDFDSIGFAPAGGLFYKKNYEQSAGTVEFETSDVFAGAGALKLSVRPICPRREKALQRTRRSLAENSQSRAL